MNRRFNGRLTARTLLLIELAALLVFFCVSMGLCANLFLHAKQTAEDSGILSQTIVETTSIAETLKASGGDMKKTAKRLRSRSWYDTDKNTLTLYYDERLQPSSKNGCIYQTTVTKESHAMDDTYTIQTVDIERDSTVYELTFKTLRTGGSK